jgi:hypothetical protein
LLNNEEHVARSALKIGAAQDKVNSVENSPI